MHLKFVETHRDEYRTCGHWLFLPGAIAVLHKVDDNEEVWAIHHGRVLLHLLSSAGEYQRLMLGCNLDSGELPLRTVPVGWWQAAEIPDGEPYAWGTNVCAPPFNPRSLTVGDRDLLLSEFPMHSEVILRFTVAHA
jgi:predicted cupin superfamily sugar epimerase